MQWSSMQGIYDQCQGGLGVCVVVFNDLCSNDWEGPIYICSTQNPKTPDVAGWYPSQSKLCKQWEEEMKRLNTKYNLDCFQNLNLIQNQMKGKNANVNMIVRPSFNENIYAIAENL